jgi:hypothetical protein
MTAGKEKVATGVLLWIFWAVDALSYGAITKSHGHIAIGLNLAERLALLLLLVSWVDSDARIRRQRLVYDFDLFIALAWPIALLYYLFRSRGNRAILTLLGFAGFVISAILAGYGALWLVNR